MCQLRYVHMALSPETRHHRFEARRARRRERIELRTPEQKEARRAYKIRSLERGAVQNKRFFLAIGRWVRARSKLEREARAKRNDERDLPQRHPLTERRLELVEHSPENAVRPGRKREWLPVDEKRAEGRLKRIMERRGFGRRTAVAV